MKVTDNGSPSKSNTATITVNLSDANDAPEIVNKVFYAPENQTDVTTISVSDVDKDELSLSLDGIDAASFILSNENVLRFKEEPDYEAKTSYGITLSLTDGIETINKDIIVNVTNVVETAPTFRSLPSSIGVDENTLKVYQIKTFDEEGQKVIFTLSGKDAAQFNLSEYGLISFKTAKDYETLSNKRYDIIITISNGVLSQSRNVIVIIRNLNENQIGESLLGNSKLE